MSKPRTTTSQSYKSNNAVNDDVLWEDMPYFIVPHDALVDVGDGFAAKYVSFPYYCYSNGYCVRTIINKRYDRIMLLSFILNCREIVVDYTKHIKKYYRSFSINFIDKLESFINKYKITVLSPFSFGDILLYVNPPDFIKQQQGELLRVVSTIKVFIFACLQETALTTKIVHLDADLNESQLMLHKHFRKAGTLTVNKLLLLVKQTEIDHIGELTSKCKAIALKVKNEKDQLENRYKNRVKISEKSARGTLNHLHKLLKSKQNGNIGIVTSHGFPLARSSWKYDIQPYLKNMFGLNEWINTKNYEYHKLNLTQLAEITSTETAKLELDDTYSLTWEAPRIQYHKIDKEISIKGNLIRIDVVNKIVVGSNKKKLKERYERKKIKKQQEKLLKKCFIAWFNCSK